MFNIHDLYIDYVHQSSAQLFNMVKSELSQKTGAGLDSLEKCYRITEEYTNMHQRSKSALINEQGIHVRKSGEPYINHPLRVALILIEENISDLDVIIAAIMHDLYEDTSYTFKMAESDFGYNVAKLIECVTNVSESQSALSNNLLSAETYDYTQIINSCRDRKIAFYIKFADRLDNLCTLSVMPKEKQIKKIEDTEKYLIPLMSRLNATRFKSFILDEIYRIRQSFQEDNEYVYLNDKINRSNAFKSAQKSANALKLFYCTTKKRAYDLHIIYPTCFDISEQLKATNLSVRDCRQDKLYYNLYIINKPTESPLLLPEIIHDITHENDLSSFAIEYVDNNSIYLVDIFSNHFILKIMTPCDFNIYQYGSTESDIPIVPLGSIEDELSNDKITIYPVDRKKCQIPRGATVIDLAFMLGRELGMHLAGAKINDTLADIIYELHDLDTVELIISPELHPTPKVYWLLNCKTQTAKFAICEFLQMQIDDLILKVDNK